MTASATPENYTTLTDATEFGQGTGLSAVTYAGSIRPVSEQSRETDFLHPRTRVSYDAAHPKWSRRDWPGNKCPGRLLDSRRRRGPLSTRQFSRPALTCHFAFQNGEYNSSSTVAALLARLS